MRLIIIAHDIRSAHNVGSLARSADAFGVGAIYCTGITPYVHSATVDRPPHLRNKMIADIHKTALNAEKNIPIIHSSDIFRLIEKLRSDGYKIAGLEQDKQSTPIDKFKQTPKLAIILGSETEGITKPILSQCDVVLEIPMVGKKESLNVSVAGAIAMYELLRS